MIHILDTDIFTIAQLRDSPEYMRLHAHALMLDKDDKLVTTIVTYDEQTRGWLAYAAKSRQTNHQIVSYARLKKHLQSYLQIEVLEFDENAGAEYDRLIRLKLRIGTADLRIASIALAHQALLISRNLRDFTKIPNLRVTGLAFSSAKRF